MFKWNEWPPYPTGPDASPFPMAVICTTAWQQAPVEVLTDDEVPEAAAKHASQKGKARHASKTGRHESHILPGYSGASGNINISDAEEEHQPPPHHTDTSTRDPHVYQNYQDFTEQITGHTYKCPFDLRTDIHVPSLGTFLDDYVDSFGYETKFIHRAYKVSERSTDRYDFMARTSRFLSQRGKRYGSTRILISFRAPLQLPFAGVAS
ncbi:uncharacterized protein PHACADRAFT_202241 [Phanerochaete carnosa HHB-10118-sp]|uniref:Uncharacterized protein n=1 Tax=Phanerochaete carnosa (strain HHB-10118-sp) TaxID=650164 RepID=K5VQR9_PHACS|nr:uncharacterized protein PHACADRAFT_202241 [Phanerochaete carnosa HHB-10118-sp]EKM48914.1 hypothetical protein PHACADRAFT_202241 [Phanerochaete carnosa HHB-10118-sp]